MTLLLLCSLKWAWMDQNYQKAFGIWASKDEKMWCFGYQQHFEITVKQIAPLLFLYMYKKENRWHTSIFCHQNHFETEKRIWIWMLAFVEEVSSYCLIPALYHIAPRYWPAIKGDYQTSDEVRSAIKGGLAKQSWSVNQFNFHLSFCSFRISLQEMHILLGLHCKLGLE